MSKGKFSFNKLANSDNFAGYLFIMPWLLGLVLLTVTPLITSMYISFCSYDLLGSPEFVGWKNFEWLFFKDTKFWKTMYITLFYVITAVPLRLVVALLIAMVLNKKGLNTGFYRTAYYLPSIIGSSVAVAIVWRLLFGSVGIINKVIFNFTNFAHWISNGALFAEGALKTDITLIGMPSTAIWVIVLLYVWEFGSSMLIFLAGLQNIPDMYYEAALVEGAGFWSRFFFITVPLLSPIILFNLVMQMIRGFLVFTQVYIITEGGPVDSTLVYAVYMFRRAFEFYDMGAASAMAWIMLIVIGIASGLVFFTSKYWVYYESKEGR